MDHYEICTATLSSSPKLILLMAHGSSVGVVQSLSLLTFSSFGLEDFYLFFLELPDPKKKFEYFFQNQGKINTLYFEILKKNFLGA